MTSGSNAEACIQSSLIPRGGNSTWCKRSITSRVWCLVISDSSTHATFSYFTSFLTIVSTNIEQAQALGGGMSVRELAADRGGGSCTSGSESYLYTYRCARAKSKGIFAMISWDLSLAISPTNPSENVRTAYNKSSRAIGKISVSISFTLITAYWRIRLKATQYNILY